MLRHLRDRAGWRNMQVLDPIVMRGHTAMWSLVRRACLSRPSHVRDYDREWFVRAVLLPNSREYSVGYYDPRRTHKEARAECHADKAMPAMPWLLAMRLFMAGKVVWAGGGLPLP